MICNGNNLEEKSMSKKVDFYRCHSPKQYFSKNISSVNQVKKIVSYNEMITKKSFETSPNSRDSPWPMFCHDIKHTGQSPFSTKDNPGVEKWRFENGGLVEDTPVISHDGTIYFGGSYGELPYYLITLFQNGTLQWRFRTGGLIWGSSPAIGEDGTIYIGSWDHHLYAINPNGTLKWIFSAGGTIATSPAIDSDGTIYFGTMRGFDKGDIFAVNSNGTEKWCYSTGYYITSNPAIAEDGTICIGSGDNYLYALYPNGTLRWRFKTGDEIHSHPSIVDDGTIYIGSNDGYLYAIYLNNGSEKWRFNTRWGMYNNPSIGSDGIIFIGTDKLYAVYPNGTLQWNFNFGYDEWVAKSSPAISDDGTIYIGTHIGSMSGGNIVAVNRDGTERWRKRIASDWVESSPSIGEDGSVYIGSSWHYAGWPGGFLHAFGRGPLNIDANGPYNGYMNEDIQFTCDILGGIPPYNYRWDFGDGHQSDQENPLYNYSQVGAYQVSLTVTDSEGNTSSDNTTATISYHLPTVSITKPIKALYINDNQIRRFIIPDRLPLIIGSITIEATAAQEPLGIDRVEFYIDGKLRATDYEAPYTWKWIMPALLRHRLVVTAYDTMNNTASTGITVWKFF